MDISLAKTVSRKFNTALWGRIVECSATNNYHSRFNGCTILRVKELETWVNSQFLRKQLSPEQIIIWLEKQ
tara:strand:+ start:1932 stop:2144 length:213 start_codon:yes stop_codon:yes gene_type:complete